MPIIFLDFDGVLDNAYYDMLLEKQGLPQVDKYGAIFDPKCITNLGRIIDATGAKLIISSDWKYTDGLSTFQSMWIDRGLPGEVIDVTPNCSPHRGDEIDAWLNVHKGETRYVIIDNLDGSNFHPLQISHLVVVNPYNGLDEEATKRAIYLLSSEVE